MPQKEIIKYYEDNGGLQCKNWTIRQIQNHIKGDLGISLVTPRTAIELRNAARIINNK